MKYGAQFETESVPEWSLHNIDYNSLKHHIKAHTTRDQATAITIPGHQDAALARFEDELFTELCRQHDRVDLFVTSKADEISRRLQFLSTQIHRAIVRSATSRAANGGEGSTGLKRQRRLARYEQELLRCGDDARALRRFVAAQVVAFRKILKKYRKWTGSSTLGSRFCDCVLSHPKSFTRKDFGYLEEQYEDLLATLHAASPPGAPTSGASSPAASERLSVPARPERRSRRPSRGDRQPHHHQLSPSETIVAVESQGPTGIEGYWNEYDHGSEAGDLCERGGDGEYAIYINPNDDVGFPGMKALGVLFAAPAKILSAWILPRPQSDEHDNNLLRPDHATADATSYGNRSEPGDAERGPLLAVPQPAIYGSVPASEASYFSKPPGDSGSTPGLSSSLTDTDAEDPFNGGTLRSHCLERRGSHSGGGYASSDEFLFPIGYRAHYAADSGGGAAIPSLRAQRGMAKYRETMLFRGAWACFGVSFVLMGMAAVLVAVGRQKMRLEVDAGATLAVMTSLGLACAGLCMTSARREPLGWMEQTMVGVVFAGSCVANGALLVMVVKNGPLKA